MSDSKINAGLNRRDFIVNTGKFSAGVLAAGGLATDQRVWGATGTNGRMRVAVVGTGQRGPQFARAIRNHIDTAELVGVCDKNPGRLEFAHNSLIGADCPSFVNLGEMLVQTKPDWLVVTTWDWDHHNCIVEGMKHGCNIICEKPLTIDEQKAQVIRDAEKQYGKKVIVTMNYRFSPHRGPLKQLLMNKVIGDITTVDFHWNITHSHLQRYLQRWHGESDKGGTLWVHKSTHHFDLINWWLDSEPVEVFAYADLERFGPKGPFRGQNCRNCEHTDKCDYYWDITRDSRRRQLYAENEHYDGYIRDNCVFRNEIDIFDKHACVVKYANNVYLNYSLTADTNHSGFWIAFNGTEGRIEGREGGWGSHRDNQEWIVTPRGSSNEVVLAPFGSGGHWGGDPIMFERLFKDQNAPDPLGLSAGTRDGVLSVLTGVAARKSSRSGRPVRIEGLTDIKPMAKRPHA